jgi:pimeloyl-ACP methyl ester carboxylesterase
LKHATIQIVRGFVAIAEGQVHYRQAGSSQPGQPPLVMFHASPGSAKSLEPLMRVLASSRRVIALDTLGNGDSCAPHPEHPDLAYFAQAHLRAITALGIGQFDAWGAHTGANIACELAIENPERIRSLIIDGIGLYSPQEQAELLQHYLPSVHIDQQGSQFHLLWHFVRDAYLFWPWYQKDSQHRRPTGLPSASDLHDKAVEVFKAARTFQQSYKAALSYPKEQRLPLLTVPTLLTCARQDMLHVYFEKVCALVKPTRAETTAGMGTPEALHETAAVFERFLEDLAVP